MGGKVTDGVDEPIPVLPRMGKIRRIPIAPLHKLESHPPIVWFFVPRGSAKLSQGEQEQHDQSHAAPVKIRHYFLITSTLLRQVLFDA